MKKLIFLISLCYSTVFAQSNPYKITYDEKLDHAFFHSSDSIYNPMTLVFKDENGRTHYDNVPDSSKYLVESNCMVSKDPERNLRFADARLKNDTLCIFIHEGNPAETNEIFLMIYKGQLIPAFDYGTPMTGSLKTTVSLCQLTLQKKTYKKGEWIKGKIELSGTSVSKYCRENNFTVEGYFKCMVE